MEAGESEIEGHPQLPDEFEASPWLPSPQKKGRRGGEEKGRYERVNQSVNQTVSVRAPRQQPVQCEIMLLGRAQWVRCLTLPPTL